MSFITFASCSFDSFSYGSSYELLSFKAKLITEEILLLVLLQFQYLSMKKPQIVSKKRGHRCYQWIRLRCHHSPKKSLILFSIVCSTASVAPTFKRPDFFSDSAILITSSLSSFEMKKVTSFPAFTAPCANYFFQIYIIQTKLF